MLAACVEPIRPSHDSRIAVVVTGQLVDTPTRGLPTRGLDDSRTGHLADWSTRVLGKSRTGQLADVTGDSPCLVFVLLAASASPRDVQSASWQSASWRIRELSSYRGRH